MTKECTCKGDKVDPNCPACNKKVDYLKDFHRLNPEAKPKPKTQGSASVSKQASADRFKIANPYANYGQYGEEKRDDGPGLGTALAVGGGALGANMLHSGLMNSRGRFAQGYQDNLGNAIRERSNQVRGAVGMDPVAMPPHPLIGKAKDILGGIGEAGQQAYQMGKKVVPMATGVASSALGAKGVHDKMMGADHRVGRAYQKFVGGPLEQGAAAAKEWFNAPATPAAEEATKVTPPPPKKDYAGEQAKPAGPVEKLKMKMPGASKEPTQTANVRPAAGTKVGPGVTLRAKGK